MQRRLGSVAYRIYISIMAFITSALLALLIAWRIVGSVAARAAGTRPASVLRYE